MNVIEIYFIIFEEPDEDVMTRRVSPRQVTKAICDMTPFAAIWTRREEAFVDAPLERYWTCTPFNRIYATALSEADKLFGSLYHLRR